jgi:ComF family protein
MRTGVFSAAASSLLDVAFPPCCAGCSSEGEALCPRCRSALNVRLHLPAGSPLGLPAAMPLPLAQLEWCAPFSGTVRLALHSLKYAGEQRLAGPLAAAVASRWRVAGAGGEVLVPVPVHADRARRRGYDQAVLLTMEASRLLQLPFVRALERRRNTRPQFDLGRTARRTNVAGAFAISGPRHANGVCGRWVVLVDDVVTTGATLVACAETLYDAGALAVSAVTVARER